jgi:hypothetical protein
MKSTLEEELRELFDNRASAFTMNRSLPSEVTRRARRRTRRVTSITVVVALALGSASLVALRAQNGGPLRPTVGANTGTAALELVDYVNESQDPHGSGLEQYALCMRDQGFDVPDPVRTANGWRIAVPGDGIDRSSQAWQEAAFVTCPLARFMDRPLSGDLILGFSEARVSAYASCLRRLGFDLPPPVLDDSGNYRFHLKGSGIDTSSDAWNHAAFITCPPSGR